MSINNFLIVSEHLDTLLKGFWITILISLIALVGSFILGFGLALLRFSGIKIIEVFARWYVEVLRNIPLLVTIFFFYYALPAIGLDLSGLVSGIIGLTLYTTAYIAEVVRSGIQSVDKGQTEAGRSTGLNYIQTMIFLILPQAFRIIIPPLGNQFITIIKNSAVLAFFSGLDLMYQGEILSSKLFIVFEVYIVVWMFYLILIIPLSTFINYLERRLEFSD